MTGIEGKFNAALAAGAISSLAWLPLLEQASYLAGLILPILGVVLVVLQTYRFFKKRKD